MILGKNIIVINQRKEMLDLLYDLEFSLMPANDCIEGIRQTIRYQPDLVIADINSPNLNGLSMARILNTLMIKTPIILTASDLKYRKHALSFPNVNGFLLNPGKDTGITRDKARKALESVIFDASHLNLESVEFSYSFRQREWACLMGKSGRPKLLIIEDDTAVKIGLLRILDDTKGYDLFSAEDGLEGVFKALLVEPQMILTDISMPMLDGLAMCQIFNILDKPFPVVFITSLEHKEIPDKALKSKGVMGIIDKKMLTDPNAFIGQINDYSEQASEMRSRLKQNGTREDSSQPGNS